MHEVRLFNKVGYAPIEAVSFLQAEFPEVPHWSYVHSEYSQEFVGLTRMLGNTHQAEGSFGDWRWTRLQTSYPRLILAGEVLSRRSRSEAWVGAVRVHGPDSREFIVFSYLSHRDQFGCQYLFSIDDNKLIRSFVKAAHQHFSPRKRGRIRIVVMNGPDIEIARKADETVFLPDDLQKDIDMQVNAFFENGKFFKKLPRYQRGFLFVGPPGTGKTMTVRRLVRMCNERYRANFFSLSIGRKTDEDALGMTFHMAEKSAPSVLILEDMDSLTRESMVTRATFLSYLDGMKSNKGILIIGTTNNPEDIDPALVHRPSRFDRVWVFPVPDRTLRRKFLSHHFGGADPETISQLVSETGNWSYAYLNELRMTAAILAVSAGDSEINDKHLLGACDLLSKQFNAARKNHTVSEAEEPTGFRAA